VSIYNTVSKCICENEMTITSKGLAPTQTRLFDFDELKDNTVVLHHDNNNKTIPLCYPFVKWAGGKTQLLTELNALVPTTEFDRYFEPFLGGGALFFYLISAKNKRFTTAYISDINSELINSYIAVKDNVERLTELLKLHEIEYKKAPVEYYYNLRSNHNLSDSTERAARFIALNRTCFNGLYRVNSNGMFNVPIGKYKNPTICNSSNLMASISVVINKK
jgi:DNA adenine methylase